MRRVQIQAVAALLVGGACAFGAGPPVPPKPLPRRDAARSAEDNMFPGGRFHDFGKVKRGPIVKHDFRVVNTSDVPVKILGVRRH